MIYQEGELVPEATIKSYLIVRPEGQRRVSRAVQHYSLPAILAVGFRVRSARGIQFRQWATARLVEGFEIPFGLELLATVRWLASEAPDSTAEQLVANVHAWNTRKLRFSPHQILLARDVLATQGWFSEAT